MTTTNETIHGGVDSAAAVTQELRQGADRGSAPPPPPPPAAGNVDHRVIRDQVKAKQRELRDARLAGARSTLRNTNPRYWWYAGAVITVAAAAVGCRNIQASQQAFQRDTAMALAQASGEAQQPAAETSAVASGIPNPLDRLRLSTQAVWTIGAAFQKNDRGEVVGFTPLPPMRSATVLSYLIERVDLCTIYVGLSDKAEVLVSDEPTAGFDPLLDSSECGVKSLVPTPQDLMPTTTVAPS